MRDRIGQKNIFEEIMAKNFSNLMKNINLQIQEIQIILSRMNRKMSIPRQGETLEEGKVIEAFLFVSVSVWTTL